MRSTSFAFWPPSAAASGSRCRSSPATAAVTPRIFVVTGRDHAFDAPDIVASGVVTFRLNDLGPAQHHLIVFRLDDTVSMRGFYEGMRAGVVTPDGITALGGPESKKTSRSFFARVATFLVA